MSPFLDSQSRLPAAGSVEVKFKGLVSSIFEKMKMKLHTSHLRSILLLIAVSIQQSQQVDLALPSLLPQFNLGLSPNV